MGKVFPGAGKDPAVARLLTALESGPGHALVIGTHAADADALFAQVDGLLTCHRRLRTSGAGLDPETVVSTIGADLAAADPPPSPSVILSALAAQARAAGAPILVVITRAEEAPLEALERLCTLLDEGPEARATIRLVLLGGPRLTRMLARPDARAVSARFLTTVHAPPCERAVLDAPPRLPVAARRGRQIGAGIGAGLALSAVALLVGSVRHWGPSAAPDRAQPSEPVAAAPPPPALALAVAPEVVAEAPVAAVAQEPPTAGAPTPTAAVTPARPAMDAQEGPIAPAREAPVAMVGRPASATTVAPAAARVAPAPPPRHARGESLQIGAFRQAENAEALRREIARLFPDAHVSNVTLKGIEYYRVRLGPADEHELIARTAALRAAGYAAVRVRD